MTDSSIMDELDQIKHKALEALKEAASEETLQSWKTAFLGRSAAVMQVFSRLPQLDKEIRPQVGQAANQVKVALEAAFAERAEELKQQALARSLASEKLDITLPGRPIVHGRLHPDTQILRELFRVFGEMGFQVYRSREVETDEYNFQMLNFPVGHPARDMQDTYFVEAGERGDNPIVMRTHTSPGQVRVMRELCPAPIRVILPGRVYRYEQVTARSESMFHQVEGLAVGKSIRMSDLKGVLERFAMQMFGGLRRWRFRGSYFPFTEPSMEMDIECVICGGPGCPVCKYSGWVEILGSGMVHPNVLRDGGYDPAAYSGFAFGMGNERITMLKYGINDIRYFFANDPRFLEQFG